MLRVVRSVGIAAVGALLATGLTSPSATAAPAPARHAARPAPQLSITTDQTVYRYGAEARFTAHLGDTKGPNRTVLLYAEPAGAKPVLIRKGRVNRHGALTARVVVRQREVFTARYEGDAKDAAKTVHARRNVRVHIHTVLQNSYRHVGRVHYVHPAKKAHYAAVFAPNKAGHYGHFLLQGRDQGVWVRADSRPTRIDANSVAGVTFHEPKGFLFRVRVSYAGDAANAAQTSPWTYVRFG